MCRSWEGTEPGSQSKLASGNIPYHRRHTQFMNGFGQGAGTFFCEFGEFCEFSEICKIREFRNCCLGTGCAISHRTVRKIVLCVTCFAFLCYYCCCYYYCSFLCCFIKLSYLNPQVFLFVCLPLRPTGEGRSE